MSARLVAVVACVLLAFAPAAHAGTRPAVIYIDNVSESVTDLELDASVAAFQTATSRDFAPVWGADAVLTTDPLAAATADMSMRLEDDSDECSIWGCALGYHDVAHNKPYSRVFARTTADFHDSWQLVFTHELFEMLADPFIDRFARGMLGRMWLVEVCDPVQDGFYAYTVDGVVISDFITPAWYGNVRGRPVDFTRGLRRPGQVGRHGYASYWTQDGWRQVFNGRNLFERNEHEG